MPSVMRVTLGHIALSLLFAFHLGATAPLVWGEEARDRSVRFDSVAVRGTAYAHPITAELEFRLVPIEYGWLIWIGHPARPDANYAAIVTPPFHGPNPLVIEGWHLRNADNSGPNAPGEKNVNVPQETRSFVFALNSGDYARAQDALDLMLWPQPHHSEAEIRLARESWEAIDRAEGVFTITGSALGNLVVDERAWFDRMRFSVELRLP